MQSPGARQQPNPLLEPGTSIDNKYRVIERLGSGGMGEVYSVRRQTLGDTAAVKLLHRGAASDEMRARFLIEARAAARIRHPNVIEVYDFGELPGGHPYIVMQHLEGETLGALLKQHEPLPLDRIVEIFRPLCSAIEAGHRRGVIHRDIKPSNVMMAVADDGQELLKVLDFGLAQVDDPESIRVTTAGSLLGTPQYMSPEQVLSEPVGPSSDIFSLGVLLYEMLTGSVPFTAPTPIAVMLAITQGQYTPANQLRPDLPAALVETVAAALSLDPAGRPSSPAELFRRVERSTTEEPPQKTRFQSPPPDAGLSQPPSTHLFLGRGSELARLHEEARAAAAGNDRVVVVEGPTGIGKTTLVKHFANQCSSNSSADNPYNSVVAIELSAHNDRKLAPFIELAASLDLTVDPSNDGPGTGRDLAEALASRHPKRGLLVVILALHHASEDELTIVRHLCRSLAGHAFIIATACNAADPAASGSVMTDWFSRGATHRELTRLHLGPFDRDLVRRWLEASFPGLRIHPRDVALLHRFSSGNPYFLSETAADLVTRGVLRWNDGWWCASIEQLELSPPIRAMLTERCDQLPESLLGVLQTAAAIGPTFNFDTLTEATDEQNVSEDELDALLEQASTRQLLHESDDGFSFCEEPFRQVLYQRLSRRRRRRLHQRLAKIMASRPPARIQPIELARHHHNAGEWHAAFTSGLEALRNAGDGSHPDQLEELLKWTRDAADHLREAGEPRDPGELAELDLLTGAQRARHGHLDQARGYLARAAELASRSGRTGLAQAATTELATCLLALGDHAEALTCARSVVESAKTSGDRRSFHEARLCEVAVLSRLGRTDEALSAISDLVAQLSPDNHPRLRSLAHRQHAWVLLKIGEFRSADREAQKALDIAQTEGDLFAEHQALSAKAAILGESDDDSGAIPIHERALELSRRLALRRREAIDLANLGERLNALGRVAEAGENIRRALDIFIEIGDRACEGDCRVNLGRTLLAGGEQAAALESLRRGRALCETTGRVEYAAIALLAEGEAHLELKDGDGAREAFDRAFELFEKQRSPLCWRAELGRARADRLLGQKARALTTARQAAALVEEQLARLPTGSDDAGFRRTTSGIWQLISELEGSGEPGA